MEKFNGSSFLRNTAFRRLILAAISASTVALSDSAFAWTRAAAIASADGTSQLGVATVIELQGSGARVIDPRATYVEGEVLVRYRPFRAASDRQSMLSRLGAQQMREIPLLRLVQVRIPAGQTVEQAIQAFSSDPQVEHVQPNYIYRPHAVPNDPLFSQQWGYRNTGQTVSGASYSTNNPGVAGSDMSLEQVWDRITDCSSVVVAVIDTGVNYLHQDLAPNMWNGAGYPYHGYDFVDNDNDPMPADASGHGTHVAATIGARGNNGIAGSGVCWNARIMAIRSLREGGGTTASVVAGIDFAVTNGAQVINMSLGGSVYDATFDAAITTARNAGVVVVVAAGNSTSGNNNDTATPQYPCNFTQDNLLCVAALDQAYNLATFSNRGAISVDVGAPGANVLSAFPGPEATEDFSSGWNMGGAWTRVSCAPLSGYAATPMLVNPANWCSNGTYANNASDVSYKTFDFTGALAFNVTFYTVVNLEQNADFMGFAYRGAGGDPFVNGSTPYEISGPAGTYGWVWSTTPAECGTATCSLGIRLRSNATNVARGIGAFWASVSRAVANSTHTYVANGTSMASPHAAGVAAMVKAFNPNYTYTDTLDAIKQGGRNVSSLSGVTVTGRAVDAMGALRYIRPPTGLSASIQ